VVNSNIAYIGISWF